MSDLIVLDSGSSEIKKKTFQSRGFVEGINEWLMAHQKISLKQKVIFYRLLSTMVNAGISIVKAIAILQKQEKNPLLLKFYEYVVKCIKEGKNLSSSMRDYGDTFSDSECSIVES
jgi:type IV pilus assembly protein PilC